MKKAPECAQELYQQGIKTQLLEHLISSFDHRSWKMNFQGMLGEGRLRSAGSVPLSGTGSQLAAPSPARAPDGRVRGEGCEKGGLRN